MRLDLHTFNNIITFSFTDTNMIKFRMWYTQRGHIYAFYPVNFKAMLATCMLVKTNKIDQFKQTIGIIIHLICPSLIYVNYKLIKSIVLELCDAGVPHTL